MKKLYIFILFSLALCSCVHKDLCYNHNNYVNILVNWDNEEDIPSEGVRVNFGLLEGNYNFGMRDIPSLGGQVVIPAGNTYKAFCYDYLQPENVFVRNEDDLTKIEAFTNEATRSSYSKQYPDEQLIDEPDRFFMSKLTSIEVFDSHSFNTNPQKLIFDMKNYVKRYTIEIRNVVGVEYITSFGGAISGVSGSFFLDNQTISDDVKTIVFDANRSKETRSIVGEFKTFGHCDDAHNKNYLTMEIKYAATAPNTGYMIGRWDVTDQMHNGSYHIVIDWGIIVTPSSDGAGIDAVVEDWNDVWVPLII